MMSSRAVRWVGLVVLAALMGACSFVQRVAAPSTTGKPTSSSSSTSPTSVTLSSTPPPALGANWPGNGGGFGTVMPRMLWNGGDPTGYIRDVTWSTWGGAQAIGHGTSLYVGPDRAVSEGVTESAVIVAFKLGDCGTGPAYTAVEWYFPAEGQSFDPNVYETTCTGGLVGSRETPPPSVDPSSPLVHPSARGWIAVLASLPQSSGLTAAESSANDLRAGISGVMLLDSNEYPNLRPGYYVAFLGPFDSSEAATGACRSTGRAIPSDCYPRSLG